MSSYAAATLRGTETDPEHSAAMFLTQLAGAVRAGPCVREAPSRAGKLRQIGSASVVGGGEWCDTRHADPPPPRHAHRRR